tara:strand:+ start:1875 stop:2594 length:720 start_codon:yes stop_codon:yes gene_type:complete
MKANFTTPEKTIKIPALRISWLHVVVVVLAILWFRSCSEKRNLEKNFAQNSEVLQDTIKYYKNKKGEEIATRLAMQGEKQSLEFLLASQKDSTKQLKSLVKYYKKVAAAVRTETITQIDSIEVPYFIEGNDFSIPFSLQEKWYGLSGRSTNKGLFLDNLTIPNQQSIVIGDKKTGFFKTQFRIDVINSNPYIKTTSVDGYSLTERRKRLGIGIFAGYGFSSDGLSPILGLGVSYNLFQF